MIVVCISGEVTGGGLTFGKKYDVIKHNIREDSFLLINDGEYFLTLEEWREQQLDNKIIWSY